MGLILIDFNVCVHTTVPPLLGRSHHSPTAVGPRCSFTGPASFCRQWRICRKATVM